MLTKEQQAKLDLVTKKLMKLGFDAHKEASKGLVEALEMIRDCTDLNETGLKHVAKRAIEEYEAKMRGEE